MREFLREILCALSAAEVEYVIAGGVAAVLHGVERATMDVDLSLNMEAENIDRFLEVMATQGLVPRAPLPADVLRDAAAREAMVRDKNAVVFSFVDPNRPARQVDVFIRSQESYGSLCTDASSFTLHGCSVRVASVPQLIRMKESIQTKRSKDEADLQALRALNGVDS